MERTAEASEHASCKPSACTKKSREIYIFVHGEASHYTKCVTEVTHTIDKHCFCSCFYCSKTLIPVYAAFTPHCVKTAMASLRSIAPSHCFVRRLVNLQLYGCFATVRMLRPISSFCTANLLPFNLPPLLLLVPPSLHCCPSPSLHCSSPPPSPSPVAHLSDLHLQEHPARPVPLLF